MKNKPKQTTKITIYPVLFTVLLAFLFTVTNVAKAETIVTNSVSVTANGGVSSASVKTIVNGEVVEDWSATSTKPIMYSQTITSDKEDIVKTTDEEAVQSRLKAMIAQLEALILLYVSLLNY